MILNLTSHCVMGVEAEEDININTTNKDCINEENINKKVDFYNIYEEILKMSGNYEIQNVTKRPSKNIKMFKRPAIWFDK